MGLTVPDRQRQICSRLGTSYLPHVPVSEAPDYLKAACIHCQGKIEFPKTGVGQVIACPHCNQATTLATTAPAKASHKRLFVAVGGVACVTIVVLAVMVGRQLAETSFPLADAYKQPPQRYTASKDGPLYGIVVTDDGKGRRLVARSAQVLDELIALATKSEQQRQKDEQFERELLDIVKSEIESAVRDLPTERAEERAKQIRENWRDSNLWKSHEAKAAASRAAVDEQTRGLIARDLAFAVAVNTRVRVLDVSGYYVKFRVLEGAQKGAIGFITPRYVLVK